MELHQLHPTMTEGRDACEKQGGKWKTQACPLSERATDHLATCSSDFLSSTFQALWANKTASCPWLA